MRVDSVAKSAACHGANVSRGEDGFSEGNAKYAAVSLNDRSAFRTGRRKRRP
jgi:hypothetical protein